MPQCGPAQPGPSRGSVAPGRGEAAPAGPARGRGGRGGRRRGGSFFGHERGAGIRPPPPPAGRGEGAAAARFRRRQRRVGWPRPGSAPRPARGRSSRSSSSSSRAGSSGAASTAPPPWPTAPAASSRTWTSWSSGGARAGRCEGAGQRCGPGPVAPHRGPVESAEPSPAGVGGGGAVRLLEGTGKKRSPSWGGKV